jgi:ubiquitin C-terminal hydrolase
VQVAAQAKVAAATTTCTSNDWYDHSSSQWWGPPAVVNMPPAGNSAGTQQGHQQQQQAPVGLDNPNEDNRCWVNAVAQVLQCFPDLLQLLEDLEWSAPALLGALDMSKYEGKDAARGAETLQHLLPVLRLAARQRTESITGCDLDAAIIRFRQYMCRKMQCDVKTQQCAHELLTLLLQHLAVSGGRVHVLIRPYASSVSPAALRPHLQAC